MNDVRYGLLYNVIQGANPAAQVLPVAPFPGRTNLQYALITGNQDDPQRAYPGVAPDPTNLNPAGKQANFTTLALFWYQVNPRLANQPVAFSSGLDPGF